MTYSFSGIAYTIFTLSYIIFCWRLFQYWKKEKNRFSKFLFFAGIFFFFYCVVASLRILFLGQNLIPMEGMIAIGSLMQTIIFSCLAYCIFIVGMPKVNPWAGVIPVFILGIISSLMALNINSVPYIDNDSSFNWGFQPQLPLPIIIRGALAVVIFISVVIIFIKQFEEAKDRHTKRKSIGFILMFAIAFLISVLDFYIINVLKLKPIVRDIAFIFLSFIVIFINTLSFSGPKEITDNEK